MRGSAVSPDLPPVLAAIARVAGEAAALKIAEAHGGTRVTLPVGPGSNWLTTLVGREAAAAIVEELGAARRVDIPIGPEAGYLGSRRGFIQKLRERTDAGDTAPQIARALGTTERGVRRWWARWRIEDNRQGQLPLDQ